MLYLFFEEALQLTVGHMYTFAALLKGISCTGLASPLECPLIRSCMLRLNFVENCFPQFSLQQGNPMILIACEPDKPENY